MPLTSHNRMSKTLPSYLANRVSQVARKQESCDDLASLTTAGDLKRPPELRRESSDVLSMATVTSAAARLSTPVAAQLLRASTTPSPDFTEPPSVSPVLNQTFTKPLPIRVGGTKRESPRSRSRPSPRPIEVSDQTADVIVIRPRPTKQSPRTLTSLDRVDLWETSDADDDDRDDNITDDVTEHDQDFQPIAFSNRVTPADGQKAVHLLHPLRIIKDFDDTAVRRSVSPIMCKRNKIDTIVRPPNSDEISGDPSLFARVPRPPHPAERSRHSVVSPRDHRSRPRSRCGRRLDMTASSSVVGIGPAMSVESPKIHDSSVNPLRLLQQQQPNSVYTPVTDLKTFAEIRRVHRMDTSSSPTVSTRSSIANDSEEQRAEVNDCLRTKEKGKSKLPDSFRRATHRLPSFDLRASFSCVDTSTRQKKVPHYLVRKVTFNRVVTVSNGQDSTKEDLRSSGNSAQMIRKMYLATHGRRTDSTDQSKLSSDVNEPESEQSIQDDDASSMCL